ncbi:MAG TPA: hexitol phosphatase HxpB [Flavobacteriales bacterium]|nr:hexitol phosphatase HxpB [Flavobacteriales bacterium]
MSPQAVIFDMDGVIIDSEPFWRQAEKEAFARQSILLTDDMCRSTAGLHLLKVVEHWQKRFGYDNETKKTLFTEIDARVIELIHTQGKAFDGLIDLIEFLKQKNIKVALASGSSHKIIKTVLRRLHLEHKFEVIRSGEDEMHGKPHPQIFITTAQMLEVDPVNCLVVEDSRNGVIAGKAARMKVVAMPEQEIKHDPVFAIADYCVESLSKIQAIIGR